MPGKMQFFQCKNYTLFTCDLTHILEISSKKKIIRVKKLCYKTNTLLKYLFK